MTKIIAVRARCVAIPLPARTSFSSRSVHERHYGLIEVEGDDGVVGLGFCYVGSMGGRVFRVAVEDVLRDFVLGRDAHEVEGIWDAMYRGALLHGRTGTVMRALSAIDIALWDRNARAANLPLYRYLGAARTDRVPAYASGGYYLEGKTNAMLADEAEAYVKDGFTIIKVKVGLHADPVAEGDRVAAVRERVGPSVGLMLDANNAWPDLMTALRFIRHFEPHDPMFIEEPFSPDDIESHARLAQATTIPVATGEIEAGRWRFRELLDRRGAHLLQTDACVAGGITEFRRIAAIAAAYGVPLAPHWFHDLHAHLVAATPNACMVEYFPDSAVLNFRELLTEQVKVENGHILLTDRPGLGFDFDEQQVSKYELA